MGWEWEKVRSGRVEERLRGSGKVRVGLEREKENG
jgi:hypothetical protein